MDAKYRYIFVLALLVNLLFWCSVHIPDDPSAPANLENWIRNAYECLKIEKSCSYVFCSYTELRFFFFLIYVPCDFLHSVAIVFRPPSMLVIFPSWLLLHPIPVLIRVMESRVHPRCILEI